MFWLPFPRPLVDRMEVIELSGYTEEEKLAIARRHLVPKQLEQHGLREEQLNVSDNALREIIRSYTREAGVRNLERQLAALCRKAAMEAVRDESARTAGPRKQSREILRPVPLSIQQGKKNRGWAWQRVLPTRAWAATFYPSKPLCSGARAM